MPKPGNLGFLVTEDITFILLCYLTHCVIIIDSVVTLHYTVGLIDLEMQKSQL